MNGYQLEIKPGVATSSAEEIYSVAQNIETELIEV